MAWHGIEHPPLANEYTHSPLGDLIGSATANSGITAMGDTWICGMTCAWMVEQPCGYCGVSGEPQSK